MGKKHSKSHKSPTSKEPKSKKAKKSKHKNKQAVKHKADAEAQLQQQRAAVHTFRLLLSEYPQAKQELREMIWKLDDGEAVDLGGIGDPTLCALLQDMLVQLGLKQLSKGFCRTTKGDKLISVLAPVFELPPLPQGSVARYLAAKAEAKTSKSTAQGSARANTSWRPSPSSSASEPCTSADDSDASPSLPLRTSHPPETNSNPSSTCPSQRSKSDSRMSNDITNPAQGVAAAPLPQDANFSQAVKQESNQGGVDIKTEAEIAVPNIHPSRDIKPELENVTASSSALPGSSAPRRAFGPSVPAAEVLAAAQEAAAVFEATGKVWRPEGEREGVDEEEDDEMLVGPVPPEMELEFGDAPQDDRSTEVQRIMSVSGGKNVEDVDAYEVLGVSQDTPVADVKRRYWKLSLLIHPDKCSHPQADEAFKRLSLAAKVLQSATARGALDDKRMAAQMQRWEDEEAAQQERERQWRVVRGEEIDTGPVQRGPVKREDWMLELPEERRAPAVMSQVSVRAFGRNTSSSGDRSGWTKNPLEAAGPHVPALMGPGSYASTAMLMGQEEESGPPDAPTQRKGVAKRSLLEQHQEEVKNKKKKKEKDKSAKGSKQGDPPDADWVGQHPWRPFDRDKDLGPSLGKAKDAKDLLKGAVKLSNRFASSQQ